MLVDILIPYGLRQRPTDLMESMCNSAIACGHDAQLMRQYNPRRGSVLMLYGLGGRDRLPYAMEHQRQGWHVVSWDAGYWDRKTEDRRYRVSIDGFHCPQRIMRGQSPGPERWNASGLTVTNQYHPAGDIVLVGNGPKSGAVGAHGWAACKAAEIRRVCKGRRIVYRPKRAHIEPGVASDGAAVEGHIESVLRLASLVVCRHSNVAVDACRMGIPVVCEDGAASAIYPGRLEDEREQPSLAKRVEFLHRLAWWQWTECEAASGDMWPWLAAQL
jgi:hypothetical protein